MGLDNGFYVISCRRKLSREDLPSKIKYPFEKDYNEWPEIIYWRKCWGLRNRVLDVATPVKEHESYYTIDTPDQVFEVIKILIDFLDRETWEDEGDSIWDYDEMRPILQQNIFNLVKISEFMEHNPDIYLMFYDSY